MANVTPTRDGPFKIEGATLLDADGNPAAAKDPMFLCRCGHSENKPFCDGHHTEVSFKG